MLRVSAAGGLRRRAAAHAAGRRAALSTEGTVKVPPPPPPPPSAATPRLLEGEARRRKRQGTINVAVSFGLCVLSYKAFQLKRENDNHAAVLQAEQEKRARLEEALRDTQWLKVTAHALRCSQDKLSAELENRVSAALADPDAAVEVDAPEGAQVLPEHVEVLKKFGNVGK